MDMFSVVKYSSVITKIRAMYGKLLSDTQYDELMRKNRVSDVVRYLKETSGYGQILENIDETSIHRGAFERLFVRALLDDCKNIYRMLNKKERELMKAFMTRFEYEYLKIIIRSIQTSTPLPNTFYNDLKDNRIGFGTGIDLFRCLEATSLSELAEALKGTRYYMDIYPYTTGEFEYADINVEMSLDNDYLLGIMKALNNLLSGKQKKFAENFWGQEIDILNLIWIYRCRKYYNYSKEEILVHIVPYKYKLGKTIISTLVSSNLDEFREIVSHTVYKKIFEDVDDRTWESNLRSFLLKVYKYHFRAEPYDFASVMAYIYLKEIDIKNIITITEGVRYGLDPVEIKKHLTII